MATCLPCYRKQQKVRKLQKIVSCICRLKFRWQGFHYLDMITTYRKNLMKTNAWTAKYVMLSAETSFEMCHLTKKRRFLLRKNLKKVISQGNEKSSNMTTELIVHDTIYSVLRMLLVVFFWVSLPSWGKSGKSTRNSNPTNYLW